jgi:serine/threonine protein kinase
MGNFLFLIFIIFIFKTCIFYRDIKPENIMVTFENVIKIADFGLARIAKHEFELVQTPFGTPGYMGKKFL